MLPRSQIRLRKPDAIDVLDARRSADHSTAAHAVADQGLTAADFQEGIDLQDDFVWQHP